MTNLASKLAEWRPNAEMARMFPIVHARMHALIDVAEAAERALVIANDGKLLNYGAGALGAALAKLEQTP